MNKVKVLTIVLIVFSAFAVANVFGQKRSDYFAHLSAKHSAALENYLGDRMQIRPAQVSDCKDESGLRYFRQTVGAAVHPYYAVEDFNQDEIKDFAVVIYDPRRRSNLKFKVLIFNGDKNGKYKIAFESENLNLRESVIWTDGFGADDRKKTVTAGMFETDNAIWIEWENGKYVMHDAAELEN